MVNKDNRKFYLIREDVLPESVIKTLKVKDALKNNSNLSIYDAVKQFNLSRSAFYKYRETIFPVDEKILDQREFTLILYVNDIVGEVIESLREINHVTKVDLISMTM
ncbi:MAG: ACT domain-containing protein [Staphylococcus epidermidis]|nr:ACT domain-containing protein [Staphylococcus epidermidis]